MTTASRHYGMDWLRIGAFALLIFYHIGMFFVPWGWHVKAEPTLDRAALPMLFTNGWRLPLLFVVSGFASAAMLAKYPAPGRFLANRTARLLMPLIFAIIVIVPPQPWVELMFKHGYEHGFWHFWTQDYFRFGALEGIVLPTWQHLWFVAYLWVYTLLLGLMLFLPVTWREALHRWFDRLLGRPLLLLIVPITWLLAKVLLIWPGAEETHALFDDLPTHAVYLPMFLFGFALLGAGSIWAAIRRIWPLALALALVAFAGIAAVEWIYPGNTPAPDAIMQWFAALRVVNGWAMIVALLGIADRYWNRDHRWRATLNEAIFPFYIVHQTIIVVVGWWCLRAGLGNGASLAVLLAATIAGCWLFYRIGREAPGLRLLIGLRGWRVPHRQSERDPA